MTYYNLIYITLLLQYSNIIAQFQTSAYLFHHHEWTIHWYYIKIICESKMRVNSIEIKFDETQINLLVPFC